VYVINSKAYCFYDLNVKVIIESNDANFYGNKLPFELRNSGSASGSVTSNHISIIINSYKNIVQDVIEPRRSKKEKITKDHRQQYINHFLLIDFFLRNDLHVIFFLRE